MGETKVTQDDRILFSFLLGWDVTDNRQRILDGHFDHHVKMQKIARHRQAAEKAQQERDAVIVQTHPMRVSGMSEQYVRNGLATAIRSQGHE